MGPAKLEKERETDFPFLNFLVVVAARKNHVTLVLGAKHEAPRKVNPKTAANVTDLVRAILAEDDR